MEVPGHSPATAADDGPAVEGEPVRVTKETLQAVLEQCRRALELLHDADLGLDPAAAAAAATAAEVEDEDADGNLTLPPPLSDVDYETDELCDLLKSKVESSDFLEKLRRNNRSISCNTSDESASWDIVSATDLWEDKNVNGNDESDQDGYVLVRQEDIAEGIASFMAAYLLSLKQTKELTPNQLQEALSKTFSVKKKKSKIRKAWDGSKIVYNVASWGATAIGIYQNPAILKAASAAFWTSCQAISKLL